MAEVPGDRTAWQAPEPLEEGNPDSAATLVEVLQWHARRHPERPHVLFQRSATETDTLTYGALLAAARQVATGLRRIGIMVDYAVVVISWLLIIRPLDKFLAFNKLLSMGHGRRRYD